MRLMQCPTGSDLMRTRLFDMRLMLARALLHDTLHVQTACVLACTWHLPHPCVCACVRRDALEVMSSDTALANKATLYCPTPLSPCRCMISRFWNMNRLFVFTKVPRRQCPLTVPSIPTVPSHARCFSHSVWKKEPTLCSLVMLTLTSLTRFRFL